MRSCEGKRVEERGCCHVFCLISALSSSSPSVRWAERQSHWGLEEEHKMTASVSQSDESFSQGRNGDDEEDVQKISHALEKMKT